MKKSLHFLIGLTTFFFAAKAQSPMTPEKLLQANRLSALGISADGKSIIYRVSVPDIRQNKNASKLYVLPITGGEPVLIDSVGKNLQDVLISPDGKYAVSMEEVKIKPVFGTDLYPQYDQSNVQIYETLNQRHWDKWEDGKFNHLIIHTVAAGKNGIGKDIMKDEPYDCPTMPNGDETDFTWSPDSKRLVYVCKKKYGTDYALSTNTDLYSYEIETGMTTTITEGKPGYDTDPSFSNDGTLAWLSMERDGFEADKNDILVSGKTGIVNLTARWDGTVNSFKWSTDNKHLYFTAAIDGTIQLFVVDYPGLTKKQPVVRQLTKGDFDITGIVGQSGNSLIVTRSDMNHAPELFSVDLSNSQFTRISHVNDDFYSNIPLCKTERRIISTSDGKKMLVWVIFPPDFDPGKKYPTILYCQGGPQSALTQFYSFRWNFQLMASNGYIIVAPNRRGMPGHGVEWNEQISKDWGGQVMQDYLSAIDEISKEPFVDRERLGCVGASYGGYSAYYLAGIHNKRFKCFIAHAGVFDLKSMYGTTEELFFTNFDFGGNYWDKNNAAAQKTFSQFNPIDRVDKWDTPMLVIHGGRDYRVPESQGFQAFQALQLKGIKSKLLYFPEENHWILKPQNALIWHSEFYKWLKETL
jgi:dipeptidyl aminopeptidase/acylaminoacyl peptidase